MIYLVLLLLAKISPGNEDENEIFESSSVAVNLLKNMLSPVNALPETFLIPPDLTLYSI